jgi:SAM-dependent methyltransferase
MNDDAQQQKHGNLHINASLYRCVACGRCGLSLDAASSLICAACGIAYPIRHQIVDTLGGASADVIQELKGMAIEAMLPPEQWESIKVRMLSRIVPLEERIDDSADDPVQYSLQTVTNFDQAIALLGRLDGKRVLEIGAENNYYFLRAFRERGAECFGLNLHFQHEDPDPYLAWPEKVLGDMNNLPFGDGVFDVVLLSATSHHSPNLERTVDEVARVLKRGGHALFLNDPIGGLIKRLGGPIAHDRESLIHENEYPIWRYDRAFRRSGLRQHHLFAAFYDKKLLRGNIHDRARFARLSRLLSKLWRIRALREVAKKRLLWPAQALFGFPLNVVLQKI